MDVVSWVTDLMEALGAPGAGIAIALENLFPPLPSELFLPMAGFTASQGKMNLFAAILWTTTGSVAGALALYYLGAALGRDRIRAIAQRMPLMKVSDVDRSEEWFARHGKATVFFGRMVPIFRSLISIPAGVERMPLPGFLLLTAAGSLIWNSALILAGYVLGENYHLVERYMGIVSKVVLVLVALAVVWFVVSRLTRKDKGKSDDEPAHARK
ncbi:DedA family protein [Saccharothrix stipae]